ncbi:MAG: hypothetical protein PHZ09_03810 [Eubacteriales bacterium]|jgi:hypothetical protein|nr:hypothetical protein [Eubacteriales bacterium]
MQINTLRRSLCLLLALLIFCGLFACSDNAGGGSAETPAQIAAETEEEIKRENTPDDLPDGLDYEGAGVNILARTKSWFLYEMTVDELNGEVVNDAVYNRNTMVSERLNINLNYILKDDVTGMANRAIVAGSDDFDIVAGSAVEIVQYGARGQYYNLLGGNVPHLNLDRPWWAQYYTEQANIGGRVFFVTGDIALSLRQLAFVTFFNKPMVVSYNLENPYDLVAAGSWTIDKQAEMARAVYTDVNGDSKADYDDIYSFGVGDCINFDVYWSAFDLSLVKRDENAYPYLSVDMDKMQSAAQTILDLFYNNTGVLCMLETPDDGEQDDLARKFAAGELAFTTLRLMACDILRVMEADYGIIPCPKWNEEQDNYYTFVHDQYSVFGIPVTVPDTGMVSAVLEALAAQNYRTVTPAYYDIALNGKYLRDPESSRMLDLALVNVKIDFSWIYTTNLNNAAQQTFRDLIRGKKSADFISFYTSREKTYQSGLEKLIIAYEDLEN